MDKTPQACACGDELYGSDICDDCFNLGCKVGTVCKWTEGTFYPDGTSGEKYHEGRNHPLQDLRDILNITPRSSLSWN